MTHKTVEVDVDLSDWDDDELIEEMNLRGYGVIRGIAAGFEGEDYDYLIQMIDSQPYNWYTARIREKLFTARNEKTNGR